jgi:DNA-binding response OmpR family regulator
MKQILYVEDSMMAQMLMQRYLKDIGELTIVSLPSEARPVLEQRRFDLVISDFIFPQGDALGLINYVRRSHSVMELPIIVVSSCMDDILLDRVLKQGANDGMTKPLNAKDFRDLVERMLAKPFVRTTERQVVGVYCFEWQAGGRAYQYCPELDLKVSGESPAQAAASMSAKVEEAVAAGQELGHVWREAVVTHVVRRSKSAPAMVPDSGPAGGS